MANVNMKDLECFVEEQVQVCIHGEQGEDLAPWVSKQIKNLAFCPDNTHLRIYFDDKFFFAVPLTSSVQQTEDEWAAYDKEAGLYYIIKSKENGDAK